MANKEQLEILKKGAKEWNKWRKKNLFQHIDLKSTDLSGFDLVEINLRSADLRDVIIKETNLRNADLQGVNISGADLNGIYLAAAILSHANFLDSSLKDAYLKGAKLHRAILDKADLRGARLDFADLREVSFEHAKFEDATFGNTILGSTNFNNAEGLEKVIHINPTNIDGNTLRRSFGKIPDEFLRGCGLSDWEIESVKLYRLGLSAKEMNDIVYGIYDLRANRAIQINPLFISYNHKDKVFVDEIGKHLDEKGVRFWRYDNDSTAGRLDKVVDKAIHQNPIMLLILSENSVKSDWVEHEARTARELEKELGRDVLCPVALDVAWKDCAWPARLREQIMEYNILDFSNWKNEVEFVKMFRKLIDGLDLFYKEK